MIANNPKTRGWRFHCIQDYCIGEIPDIEGTNLDYCFAQLAEFEVYQCGADITNAHNQVLDLTHVDNAGCHICRWEVTKIQGGEQ